MNILTRHKNSFSIANNYMAISDSSELKKDSYYTSAKINGIWTNSNNLDLEYHFRIIPGLYQEQFEIFRCSKNGNYDNFAVRYNGWVFDKKHNIDDFANKIFDYFFSPLDKFENAGGYSLNLTNAVVQTSRRNIVTLIKKSLEVAINELEMFK